MSENDTARLPNMTKFKALLDEYRDASIRVVELKKEGKINTKDYVRARTKSRKAKKEIESVYRNATKYFFYELRHKDEG
jgi:hypothetical protein